MKTKLLVGLLMAGSSVFAETHVSIGIGVGGYGNGYYAPPPVVAYAPPYPGPGYSWVDGYSYQMGPRRVWRPGYWAPPVYGRTYRVEPRNYRQENRYYGDRHDDRNRERDRFERR
jgi:hypothetical protein